MTSIILVIREQRRRAGPCLPVDLAMTLAVGMRVRQCMCVRGSRTRLVRECRVDGAVLGRRQSSRRRRFLLRRGCAVIAPATSSAVGVWLVDIAAWQRAPLTARTGGVLAVALRFARYK